MEDIELSVSPNLAAQPPEAAQSSSRHSALPSISSPSSDISDAAQRADTLIDPWLKAISRDAQAWHRWVKAELKRSQEEFIESAKEERDWEDHEDWMNLRKAFAEEVRRLESGAEIFESSSAPPNIVALVGATRESLLFQQAHGWHEPELQVGRGWPTHAIVLTFKKTMNDLGKGE